MTTAQLNQIKRLLASYACEFTNTQLEILFGDAEDQEAVNPVFGAAALAFYQLAVDAITLTNFKQGETQESEAVIYDRLMRQYSTLSSQAGFPTPLPIFNVNTQRLYYVEFPEVIPDA